MHTQAALKHLDPKVTDPKVTRNSPHRDELQQRPTPRATKPPRSLLMPTGVGPFQLPPGLPRGARPPMPLPAVPTEFEVGLANACDKASEPKPRSVANMTGVSEAAATAAAKAAQAAAALAKTAVVAAPAAKKNKRAPKKTAKPKGDKPKKRARPRE
jgi:hypothetical protein